MPKKRLLRKPKRRKQLAAASGYDSIKDLVGAADGLPSDLAARKKHYLKTMGYGRNRSRRITGHAQEACNKKA